jgi:uracil-DNA glycosylase family 4
MKRTKHERLIDLRLKIQACARCPYGKTRANPIIGDGEYRSPILIIGDKPRQRDDKDGEVFAGRAGKKLDTMLTSAELNIKQTYRTYLVRCFAGRDPQFGEFSAFKRCESYTTNLIELMSPAAIVICGYKTFKWMILKWTREIVDEHSFYKWVGKAVRLKELYGELKFFIIESPASLSNTRNPELEAKSIDVLKEMKAYVVAKQRDEPIALEMVDLKRRPVTKSKQQTFGWS